jgi:hypothetical protein
LSGLGPYWHRPQDAPQGLILGYAAPPEHAYGQTLAAFARVLDELRAGAGSSRATATTGPRR